MWFLLIFGVESRTGYNLWVWKTTIYHNTLCFDLWKERNKNDFRKTKKTQPAVEPTTEDSFPGSTVVQLMNGNTKEMWNLQKGDKIFDGKFDNPFRIL